MLRKRRVQMAAGNNTPELRRIFQNGSKSGGETFGKGVYVRGLIEFSNYCKNDCYYCGIRSGNQQAHRYRLSEQEILDCCAIGYDLGFRTFVLQGGEDPDFSDQMIGSDRPNKKQLR